LEFVPDERVAELFGASDIAVVTRGDGGTSGALVLALSMGIPIIAPDRAAYEELTGNGSAAWYFKADDPYTLVRAIENAASNTQERKAKATAALGLAHALSWDEAARQTAALLPHSQKSALS
jgi:glycosyltransferase involved in cell wall biosynthesis